MTGLDKLSVAFREKVAVYEFNTEFLKRILNQPNMKAKLQFAREDID